MSYCRCAGHTAFSLGGGRGPVCVDRDFAIVFMAPEMPQHEVERGMKVGAKVPVYVSGDSVVGRDNKFVWYCIPRNASRALLLLLSSEGRGTRVKEIAAGQKPRVALFRNKPAYSFGFVRDPYKRIASAWRSKVLSPRRNRNQARFLQEHPTLPVGASLDDFVAWLGEHFFDRGLDPHLRPQSQFVCDGTGTVCLDFVGRIESLAADFAKVEAVIGPFGPVPMDAGRTYVGDEPHFGPQSRATIERLYARDFELFFEGRS